MVVGLKANRVRRTNQRRKKSRSRLLCRPRSQAKRFICKILYLFTVYYFIYCLIALNSWQPKNLDFFLINVLGGSLPTDSHKLVSHLGHFQAHKMVLKTTRVVVRDLRLKVPFSQCSYAEEHTFAEFATWSYTLYFGN